MRRKFVAAMAWLMIVAVPVQGLAASAMIHCAPGHHDSGSRQMEIAHNHDAGAASHSHEQAAAAADHSGHHAESATPTDASGLTQLAKCSACASCCLGVGVPMSAPSMAVASAHFSPRPSVAVPVLEIVVPGPERPPRISLV